MIMRCGLFACFAMLKPLIAKYTILLICRGILALKKEKKRNLWLFSVSQIWGRFHQTLFARPKVVGTQSLAKKLDVLFYQQIMSEICELKNAKSVCHLPNAFCQKKLLILKSGKHVGEIDSCYKTFVNRFQQFQQFGN